MIKNALCVLNEGNETGNAIHTPETVTRANKNFSRADAKVFFLLYRSLQVLRIFWGKIAFQLIENFFI